MYMCTFEVIVESLRYVLLLCVIANLPPVIFLSIYCYIDKNLIFVMSTLNIVNYFIWTKCMSDVGMLKNSALLAN